MTLLVPATSVALGALILDERLAARQFLRRAPIAVGLAFIDGRLPRKLLRLTARPVATAAYSRLPTRRIPR